MGETGTNITTPQRDFHKGGAIRILVKQGVLRGYVPLFQALSGAPSLPSGSSLGPLAIIQAVLSLKPVFWPGLGKATLANFGNCWSSGLYVWYLGSAPRGGDPLKIIQGDPPKHL